MFAIATFLPGGYGAWWYLLLFILSFAESFAFVGLIVPGSISVITAGALASQGLLDLGDLFIWSSLGAILGDSFSYYWGRRKSIKFHPNNKLFKIYVFEKGKQYFKKHGAKSIFFGRFIGWARPIVPFIAGIFRLDRATFLLWNITSGILWAVSHLAVGYFFGSTLGAITTWTTRSGFFAFIALFSIFTLWFLIKQSKPTFSFLFSIIASSKNAIISHQDVRALMRRYPRAFAFLKQRFRREKFSGLPFTLILIAFIYIASLLLGIIEDIITSDPIVAADIRIANLLYMFRDTRLISFFTWVTLLGKWPIVIGGAIVMTVVLWVWRKRVYIFPLWVTLIGSELLSLLGKLVFHRPRPELAYYTEYGFSFPSGHATMAVAFYGFLTYTLWCATKKWGRKAALLFWGLVIIITIGFSRLYLNVHYVSDVWGGYLSGLLLLIIGIALVERTKYRQPATVPLLIPRQAKTISSLLTVAFISFYLLSALRYHPPLNTPPSKQPVIVANILNQFRAGKAPRFTETLLGDKQEPLSFIIIAKNNAELINTINGAGWHLADKATVTSVFALAQSALLRKNYPTAPMTPSFWNAKVHDFGFEKETPAQNVRERHHARFWRTNLQTPDNRHIYVGTASFDSGIKWIGAHQISPDIDTEREFLFSDLQNAKLIVTSSKTTFVAPTLGKNFSGDQFFTDGKIYLVVLGTTDNH